MKILCLGQSAFDITISVDSYPIENIKYKTNEVATCGGGSSNNSAYLLAKWKDEVYLASSIGKDDYGRQIKEELTSVGVNTKYIEEIDGVPTTTSYIINNKSNGSRTILTNRSNKLHFSYDFNIDDNFDVILFDGNDFEMALRVIDKNPNAIKIIDAGGVKEGTIELAKRCDFIVCSNDFAKEYTNINFEYQNMLQIYEAYDKLDKEFNGTIIITLEEHGSLIKINNEFKLVPSIKVESVDSTGAGDIYHGAFTHFLANGYNILDAMKYSNIAGAISVTKIGSKNSMPELEDVINYHE